MGKGARSVPGVPSAAATEVKRLVQEPNFSFLALICGVLESMQRRPVDSAAVMFTALALASHAA